MATEQAWIFVNGEIIDYRRVRAMIRPGDLLVSADGGLRHLRQLELQPHIVIGDLDSISQAEQARLLEDGVQVEVYPPKKDETDLELALNWTLKAGATRIRIAAALGSRLDHTLGNLFLLSRPDLAPFDVRLENGFEEVFLVRQQIEISGAPGDRVSLLPLGRPAFGITTEGLYYPLRDETLWPERTRGISNVMVTGQARVSLRDGLLICIHTRLDGE